MKKIGLVCDNHKLNKFKAEFAAAGLPEIKTTAYTFDTVLMTIEMPDDKFESSKKAVSAIAIKVEKYFLDLKIKNN